MRRILRALRFAVACLAIPVPTTFAAAQVADLIITNARIYTSAKTPDARALAVKEDRIIFVGSNAGARQYADSRTTLRDLHGARVLPGLIDSHIHPLDIVDLDVCDLDSKARTLRQLATFIRACLARYHTLPGEHLVVHQWNYASGNQPDAELPTLRAALDRASTVQQIELWGNDGHHGAFNSAALATAKNPQGVVVGLNKITLARDFSNYSKLIGVDSAGVPDGTVNEDAREFLGSQLVSNADWVQIAKAPERIAQRLNAAGITGILDAQVVTESLPIYDALQAKGAFTFRAALAQFLDPEKFRKAGLVDYDTMVAQASAVRAKYQHNPLIKADFIKLFADGGIEGNPYASPPALPNAAVLHPYLHPRFTVDSAGLPSVIGYDDGGDQSTGQLQHERAVILEFVRRFHLAGFNLHIHVIGDRAARTAVDAIEAARDADGVVSTRDSLAHLLLAHPDDVARIGRDHLYVAFTFAWAYAEVGYDVTVIPFVQRVQGNSHAALHPRGSYYESNVYPARGVQDAGGILVGGSDAPVETRDPRPFINIARAVTRRSGEEPALNAQQSISVRDAIDAYTFHGARFLGWERDAGSLEPGKSADFVVLDRDVIALGDAGHARDIEETRVLETWFQGRRVFAAH